MISKINEQALISGVHRENIESSAEAARAYSHNVSYESGDPADFDREFAIDREKFWRFIDYVKSAKTAPGFEEILVPGERSYRTGCEREENGVPIEDTTWEQICETAKKFDVEV